MIATDSHCGHGAPPRDACVPIAFTTGAKAISGTVWLTTIQGRMPHSARRQRCITRPSSIPTATPMSQPTAAMPRVRPPRSPPTTISGGVSPPLVDWNSRANISQMCGIARSWVRGRIMTPEPVSPAVAPSDDALGGPRNLYSSQITATARMPTAPHATADSRRAGRASPPDVGKQRRTPSRGSTPSPSGGPRAPG